MCVRTPHQLTIRKYHYQCYKLSLSWEENYMRFHTFCTFFLPNFPVCSAPTTQNTQTHTRNTNIQLDSRRFLLFSVYLRTLKANNQETAACIPFRVWLLFFLPSFKFLYSMRIKAIVIRLVGVIALVMHFCCCCCCCC